jgi:hypothetical protein
MRSRTRAPWLLLCAVLPLPLLVAGCGGDDDDKGEDSNTIEFVGRIDQEGPSFTGYGYLTHVDGTEDGALFDSPPLAASEKSARLTFRFKAQATSRGTLREVFAIHSRGTIEFFANDRPGADFDDPNSFARGRRVSRGSLDVQNIITVYAPNRGIAEASGVLSLDEAGDFEIGDEQVAIGEDGDSLRATLAGAGTRSNAVLPRSVINFAGRAVHDD